MARGTKLAGSDVMENWCRVRRLVVLLTVGCTMPQPAAQQPDPRPSALISAEAAAVEHGVFTEVNRLRRDHGSSALRRVPALDQAARQHSEELAARRMLDHYSTNVRMRTPGLRVTAMGLAWTSVAENLASLSGSFETAPQRTADIWLHSIGHRTSMLDARYTHTGVGAVFDGRGTWYVTQLYVLPSGWR